MNGIGMGLAACVQVMGSVYEWSGSVTMPDSALIQIPSSSPFSRSANGEVDRPQDETEGFLGSPEPEQVGL